jgi:hypothetical protein
LKWFAELTEFFLDAAEEVALASKVRRRPLAQPDQASKGSTADRKLDVSFANDPKANGAMIDLFTPTPPILVSSLLCVLCKYATFKRKRRPSNIQGATDNSAA